MDRSLSHLPPPRPESRVSLPLILALLGAGVALLGGSGVVWALWSSDEPGPASDGGGSPEGRPDPASKPKVLEERDQQIATLEAEVLALRGALQQGGALSQLDASERAGLQAEVDRLSRDLARTRTALESERARGDGLATRASALGGQVAALETQVSQLNTRLGLTRAVLVETAKTAISERSRGAEEAWDALVVTAQSEACGSLNRERRQGECERAVSATLAPHKESFLACYGRKEAARVIVRSDGPPAGAIPLRHPDVPQLKDYWVVACAPDPGTPE